MRCNYGRVLNIPGFKYARFLERQALHKVLNNYVRIWLDNALWQGSENAWSTFHRVLKKPPVLNMLGLRIWQGCEYARVTQVAEYA